MKSLEREIFVKGTRSSCVEECVKDNYYARFHTHRHYSYRELHFNSRLDTTFDKVSGE